MTDPKQLVNKLWNYCDILRNDGLSYGDYVEQLTFLLFLKMDDERSKPPHSLKSDIPKNLNWQSLIDKDGAELEAHYIRILNELGKKDGIIGVIFRKAQNKIQDPAKLRKLIADLIDRENWLSLEVDVKGDAYEGLLEKNAADDRKQIWSEKKTPDGRWRCFDVDEILKRDKTNLDISWIKDESLEDVDNLPDPDVIVNELVEELEAALAQLTEIASDLKHE